MDTAEGKQTTRGNECISCPLRKVPHSGVTCDWNGQWKDQIIHFFIHHSSLIHHYNIVVLEPENPKVVMTYSDMFITYAAYHKDDLACVVMHACSCTTSYYYRCTLLSNNSNCSDLLTDIIPAFTKVKKFRSIRKHKHVTRFSPEQLDCRRDAQGKTNIIVEIFGTDCEETSRTAIPGPSNGGGKDDTSEEDRSSDEESLPSKKRRNSAETMNAACGMCGGGDKGLQCFWKGKHEDLENHLLKGHGMKLGMYGHCCADFERVAPLVCYDFLTPGTQFTANPSFFDYISYKPSNCIVNLERNLCCCTIVLPDVDWRYAWPREKTDIVYGMMWDVFRPPITLNIPLIWKSVPVMGTYPCHIISDPSELKQLTVDKCPCRNTTYKRANNRPNQVAYCALNFVPGRTGMCNWIGASEAMYDHLFVTHQNLVRQDDMIILQISQPRILCAYRDAFLCYISYDRGDVVCVVLHTCECSKMYMYRCVLQSEVEGYSEVDGDMRYVTDACKDYNWIKGSSSITRFPKAIVQPRRHESGNISAIVKIYPPVEQEKKASPKSTPEYINPWINFLRRHVKDASSGAAKPSTSGTNSTPLDLAESTSSTPTVNTLQNPAERMPFTPTVSTQRGHEESMYSNPTESTLYDPGESKPFTSTVSTWSDPIQRVPSEPASYCTREMLLSIIAAEFLHHLGESRRLTCTQRALRAYERAMISDFQIDSTRSMHTSPSVSSLYDSFISADSSLYDPEESLSFTSTVNTLYDSEESKSSTFNASRLRGAGGSLFSTSTVNPVQDLTERKLFTSTVRYAHCSRWAYCYNGPKQ